MLTVIVHSGHLSFPTPLPDPVCGLGWFLSIAMGRVLVICINLGSDICILSIAGIGKKKKVLPVLKCTEGLPSSLALPFLFPQVEFCVPH